jgi:NAD-dependent deacetylase sirtuin 4
MRTSAVARRTAAANEHLEACEIAARVAEFVGLDGATLVITGAGVSTNSGIPDYRSATGMYSRPEFKPLHFGDFQKSVRYQRHYWARSMFGYPAFVNSRCNAAHLSLASMQAQRLVGPIITQNVDGLHHLAANTLASWHSSLHDTANHRLDNAAGPSTPSKCITALPNTNQPTQVADEPLTGKDLLRQVAREVDEPRAEDPKRSSPGTIYELHGNLHEAQCMGCTAVVGRRYFQHRLLEANAPALAEYQPDTSLIRADGDFAAPESLKDTFNLLQCPHCGGHYQPHVVMFGANVEKKLVDTCYQAVENANRVLCIGTSLQVYSAFRFVDKAVKSGLPVCILNHGKTRADKLLETVPSAKIYHFDSKDLAAVLPMVSTLLYR